MSKRKKIIIWIAAVAVVIAFLLSPPASVLRSMAVMKVYSAQNEKHSAQDVELKIPSGKGWYPFVMTYSADEEFQWLTGAQGAKLTVLYNFPAFDIWRGCSHLFDETSPYYSSFYGAYVISFPEKKPFGFAPDDTSLENAVSSVAKMDFFRLVLGDFGLKADEQVFEYTESTRTEDVDFAGVSGWTRIDARLRVNGANHESVSSVTSYLQYGKPSFPVSAPFAPVDMESTVLARYFEEQGVTVFFYCIARDASVRDDCVDNILSQSVITLK